MTALVVAARLADDEPFTSDRFEVRTPVLDGDEYAYWKALDAAWSDPRTLVNVEHDMEFSDELVQALVDCPHPLCTYPYLCYLRERRFYVYTPTLDGRWVLPGVEWADTSTLGFIKIAPEARTKPLRKMIWKFLEHSMCTAVSGFSQINTTGDRRAWHVHWPAVKHYHDYDTEEWSRASDWERFCAENGEPCHVTPSALAGDIRSVRLDEHRRVDGPIRYGDCWEAVNG